MKKIVVFCTVFYCCISFGFIRPEATISFDSVPPATVFYGETAIIPVKLIFYALKKQMAWYIPEGTALKGIAGNCPPIPYFKGKIEGGTCYMQFIIPGDRLGKVVSGRLLYLIWGEEWNTKPWHDPHYSPEFRITVIPHFLSMLSIPIQEATVNQHFVYNLKSAVSYYDENAKAGIPALGVVSPEEQNGLRFDPATFSITGTPTRIGTYPFKVGAKNAKGTTALVDFTVDVHTNAKDKPKFKTTLSLVSAVAAKKYTMNLLELIEPRAGFMIDNQVSFRVDLHQIHPDWLNISNDDATLLTGNVPPEAAGQEVEITLIASSNTGGDSAPLTIKIPIANDPEQKPNIEPFKLNKLAWSNIYEDLSRHINDPTHDSNLRVILEKVQPDVPWLKISLVSPTVLEGTVPIEAAGHEYALTLKANNTIGGDSESVIIPLQIDVDKERTPRFKEENPILPLVYPGQPYMYNFVANRDVLPEFEDAPYEIQFAEQYEHPSWLRLENNKLIAEMVPAELNDSTIEINIKIKNTPGGESQVITLLLWVMNGL